MDYANLALMSSSMECFQTASPNTEMDLGAEHLLLGVKPPHDPTAAQSVR